MASSCRSPAFWSTGSCCRRSRLWPIASCRPASWCANIPGCTSARAPSAGARSAPEAMFPGYLPDLGGRARFPACRSRGMFFGDYPIRSGAIFNKLGSERAMKRIAAVLLAAGAVLALGASGAKAQEEVVVAVAGPLTGSNAVFGEQMKRGGQLAVDYINAKGGVLGKKLKLVFGDDACDPKQAVDVANKLVSQKVVFVDGHYCSSSSIPASAVYSENSILQITPASTNPKLTDDAAAKGWINVFRTVGRDDVQGTVAGEYLASKYKGKKVAVIDDKSQYGKGL